MALQIVLNISLAMIWTLLVEGSTLLDFAIGYVIGLFILFLLRRLLRFKFYLVRVIAAFKLVYIFSRELILANIDVLRIVLPPGVNDKPGIIAVPTQLKSDLEITLLASLISLTPGTLSMVFSEDSQTIYVHVIDIAEEKEIVAEIRDTFEKAIMEVMN